MKYRQRVTRRRTGIVLLVCALSLALLAVEHVAGRKVLLDSFLEIEQDAADRSLHQVLKALKADLAQMAMSVRDYAAWDDAYLYAADRDPQFVQSNFVAETLANMQVDVVWMLDLEDRDILLLSHRDGHQDVLPVTANTPLSRALRAHLPAIKAAAKGKEPLARLLPTDEGLLAFASHPITQTGDIGPSRGLMVYARYIDTDELARMRDTSELPVEIVQSANALGRLPASARSLWRSTEQHAHRVLKASDDQMDAFALLRDVDGKPAAIVGTHLPRPLVSFGARTLGYLTALIAVVVGVFAVVIGFLMLRLERLWRYQTARERRYRAVITQAQDTMLLATAGGRQILESNPAASTTLGYAQGELMSMPVDDLFVVSDGETVRAVQPELHLATDPDAHLQVRCKDGKLLDVEVSATPLIIDDTEVISFVLRDVSARKAAERALLDNQQRLSHLAHHDALTGLLNRLGLQTRLKTMIAAAQSTHRMVGLLYLDIDHFKKINDLRGHAHGDQLLQVVAERLRGSVASGDLVVRMGGDEFVIVAAGLRAAADAAAIARRIRSVLAEPYSLDGQEFNVTTSVGISVFPEDGSDYEVLLKDADIALYEAKDAGRDTYRLFAQSMNARVSERLALEHALRAAIRTDQFHVEYQPIVDLRTSTVVSLEALLRWTHPTRGLIPPGVFIDIAEKAGLIAELGEFVLFSVCAQIREWENAGVTPVPVAINVSSRQFERQNMSVLVARATADACIEPSMLHLELTESAIMDAPNKLAPVLQELRNTGVHVSVDDFGTGYSSLSYLQVLPIDYLKIDRSFVCDLGAKPNGAAIVSAIIRMAASLRLRTIAEGIETLDQLRRLRELGATMGQGYYFSRPLKAADCLRLLMDRERRQKLSETSTRLRALQIASNS